MALNCIYSGISPRCGVCCYDRNGISGWCGLSLQGKFSHGSCQYSQKMGLIVGKLLASPGGTPSAMSPPVAGTVSGYSHHRLDMVPRLPERLSVCLFSSRALCKRHQASAAHLPGCDFSPWGQNSPGWEGQSDVHWLWHCAWIKAMSQEG